MDLSYKDLLKIEFNIVPKLIDDYSRSIGPDNSQPSKLLINPLFFELLLLECNKNNEFRFSEGNEFRFCGVLVEKSRNVFDYIYIK